MRALTLGPLRALYWSPPGRPVSPPLLMIHGVWVGAHVWTDFGAHLASRGYPAAAVWLRHHEPGADPTQLDGLGLEDYADDMVAAARTLGSPVLVGHSMGGLLAQVVATQTDVSGVALLASAPPFGIPTIPRLSLMVAGFRHALGWIGSGPMVPFSDDAFLSRLDPDRLGELVAHRTPEPRRLARQLTFWPPRVDSAHVRCPVWVGGGDDDPVIRPWVTRRLAAKYGIEPTIYRGAGHMLNLEPGWSTVADDLRHWVDDAVG